MLKYFETDTIWCVHRFAHILVGFTPNGVQSYHADAPAALVKLQDAHWKPILDWARSTFDVEISTTDSFLVPTQPPETILKFNDVLSTLNPWEMAGMVPILLVAFQSQ